MFALIYDKKTGVIKKSLPAVKSKNDITLETGEAVMLLDKAPQSISKYTIVMNNELKIDTAKKEADEKREETKRELVKRIRQKEKLLEQKQYEILKKVVQSIDPTLYDELVSLKKDIDDLMKLYK